MASGAEVHVPQETEAPAKGPNQVRKLRGVYKSPAADTERPTSLISVLQERCTVAGVRFAPLETA